jgi:hypothetical protein
MQDVYCCKIAYEAKQYRDDNVHEVISWINDVQYRMGKELAFYAKGRIFIPIGNDSFLVVPKNTWVLTWCDDRDGFVTFRDEDFKREFAPMFSYKEFKEATIA